MTKAQTTLDRMREKQQGLAGGNVTTPPAPPPPSPPTAGQQQPAAKKGWNRYPEFRLPDGAEFHASYDGTKQLWTVTLAVPGLPVAETTGGSIHAAMIFLGRQWFDRHGRGVAPTAQTRS
jgi:hypothetical protein